MRQAISLISFYYRHSIVLLLCFPLFFLFAANFNRFKCYVFYWSFVCAPFVSAFASKMNDIRPNITSSIHWWIAWPDNRAGLVFYWLLWASSIFPPINLSNVVRFKFGCLVIWYTHHNYIMSLLIIHMYTISCECANSILLIYVRMTKECILVLIFTCP